MGVGNNSMLAPEGSFAHGYALVTGAGADLPVTVDDATALAGLLCDPSRCSYKPENVILLTGQSATRGRVLEALNTLIGKVSADDASTAIVYFSGHGLALPEAYLMPNGYRLDDLAGTAISGREFTATLRQIRARKLLVLLDCCHAAGQAQAKALPGKSTPVPPEVLDEFTRGSGRVVIASSRSDEYSFTGDPYSVFTGALLEGLAGYGAFERDGYARVLDLALYSGRMVPNRTEDRQHPIVKVSNLEDNFALAYYAAGAREKKPLDWSAEPFREEMLIKPQVTGTWKRMLANLRENLLLIEERMSEYVEYQEIPLQLVKNKRMTEEKIADLERRLSR